MARQPRIEYEGACYHVMCRGDRQEAIFEDDQDREMFLETLGEVCERSGWKVYAWVLMSNHYHWILQTPQGNLVEGMKWFQNTYTRRFNSRHRKWGHVFGGRYKAVVVQSAEDDGGEYLCTLIDYAHLNPARAGLVHREEMGLLDYRWSSLARGYGVEPDRRQKWMAVEEGLAVFGYKDRARDRRSFIGRLEKRAREQGGEIDGPKRGLQNTLRRGWYWGSQEFRERMLKLVKSGRRNRNYRSSELGRQCARREAEELLEMGRRHFGIEEELEKAPRAVRVGLAWAIHRKTNQPQAWIAERLGLHSAANVSQQVRRFQQGLAEKGDRKMCQWEAIVKNC